tara:strand:+ start:1333 stop:2310 length:978 start_codon:yes stop_codon:yes gene_type:complete
VKIFISTAPFGEVDPRPRDILEENGFSYCVNPFGRKMRSDEIGDIISDYEILIAGTERIDRTILDQAGKLKLIVRVGIGLDSVDLLAARAKNIAVSYTPDAPSAAVSELAVGLMLNLMRSIHVSDRELHQGRWQRRFGERIGNSTVGVIGAGRIGSRVVQHLLGFDCPRILVSDPDPNVILPDSNTVERCDLGTVLQESDLVTIHVPLSNATRNLISDQELRAMKDTAYLLNTSRGGIVDERALFEGLKGGVIAGAAVDTFDHEPYQGRLQELDNCFLTAHMGSMSKDCRSRMEIEATEEAIRFCRGEPLKQSVPEEEYGIQDGR